MSSAHLHPRRRLWEIDKGKLCSILGTCLSIADLHKLARRARVDVEAEASAYHVHCWFTEVVASSNDLSKLVDKEIERRHGPGSLLVRRARSVEEIEARFAEVAARGHVAAAYWGAMSHPLCTEALAWQVFGEIHMLSHLVGASRQADLCRLHTLEVSNAGLEAALAKTKHDHRAVVNDRKHLHDALETTRIEKERLSRRLALARDRIHELEAGSLATEREAWITLLEGRLALAETRATASESRLGTVETELRDVLVKSAAQAEALREITEENAALEHELERVACPFARPPQPEADATSLCGKRILCVGGRNNLVQHYRALVERRGGELLHHDGGLEESLDAVTRAMHTVDAVVCPIDCVSHAATLKVKRACKHLAKQFVVLRSSGLSSFARGIEAIARGTMLVNA